MYCRESQERPGASTRISGRNLRFPIAQKTRMRQKRTNIILYNYLLGLGEFWNGGQEEEPVHWPDSFTGQQSDWDYRQGP